MKLRVPLSAIALVMLALLLAACGSSSELSDTQSPGEKKKNADGYTDINIDHLAAMMPDQDFTLVNVHIPYDGELPETDLFIPFDEMTQHLDQLPDKDAPIVLYCRSGSMSTSAAKKLVDLGYTNVMEVDGGFNAWKAAGRELLDNSD